MQAVCRPCAKQVAPALSPNAGTRRLGSETERGKETAERHRRCSTSWLPLLRVRQALRLRLSHSLPFFYYCISLLALHWGLKQGHDRLSPGILSGYGSSTTSQLHALQCKKRLNRWPREEDVVVTFTSCARLRGWKGTFALVVNRMQHSAFAYSD